MKKIIFVFVTSDDSWTIFSVNLSSNTIKDSSKNTYVILNLTSSLDKSLVKTLKNLKEQPDENYR